MTAAAPTWRGQYGAVVLGPTEDRVARYLADATAHGRVTLRMVDVAARLGLVRSEAYRITARLRTLGLFGVENDRGGTRNGRRWWRTAATRAGVRLDGSRHRLAWARVIAWTRARAARLLDALRALTTARSVSRPHPRRADGPTADPAPDAAGTGSGADPPAGEPGALERAFRKHAPGLAERWDTGKGPRPARWRDRG